MKYKIFGGMVVIIACLVAVGAESMNKDQPVKRIHQHLEVDEKKEDNLKSEFSTHLPLVVIDTGDKAIPGEPIEKEENRIYKYTRAENGESMESATVKVIDNEDKYNHLGDEPQIETKSKIRIRGSSSRYFPKKNYLLRFVDDKGRHEEHKVMGMDPHYEWSMHGPYLDKTLIRNYMWYNISGEIMDYAPNVRFCELFVNKEYKGLYVMTETINTGDKVRLNLKKPEKSSKSCSYVLRLDRGNHSEDKNIKTFLNLIDQNARCLDIRYPRGEELTEERKRFIIEDFSSFEKTLYSYDYDTTNYGYWNDIDVMSFVDYYLINEFSGNRDSGIYSTYLYKNLGGKLKKVVWDFNSCCDNYVDIVDHGMTLHPEKNVWDYMLFKDEHFTELVIKRYYELRKIYLSEEYLLNYIDEVVDYLGDAVDRNYEVWESSFEKELLMPSERNIHSYEEAIVQLKQYIKNRGQWMDEHIEILRQYSHESRVKAFNH